MPPSGKDHETAGHSQIMSSGTAQGLHEVRVVHETIDSGGRDGLRHDLVNIRRVNAFGHSDRAPFVCGVDDPVEGLGRVGGHRQQVDVVAVAGPTTAAQRAPLSR
jgi:hypothetical protein